MLLFFQILVLLLTALLWWSARRDLNARAFGQSASEREELEELRLGVEALSASLEQRATAAEARVAEAERRILAARPAGATRPARPAPPEDFVLNMPEAVIVSELSKSENVDLYAPVRALADAGITDAAEIARRTGLGRSEIELVLGLRARG